MTTPKKIPVVVPGDSIAAKAVRRALQAGAGLAIQSSAGTSSGITVLVDDCAGDLEHEPVIERLLGALARPAINAMHTVPLILTPRAEKFDPMDYRVPRAHILDTVVPDRLSEALRGRVLELSKWFNHPSAGPRHMGRADLHDWIVDHVRRVLKLEVDSHRPADAAYVAISRLRTLVETGSMVGDSGKTELDALVTLRKAVQDLCGSSPPGLLCELLCALARSLTQLPPEKPNLTVESQKSEFFNILNNIEGAFPRRSGVGFLSGLATRMRALVIDDDLDKPESAKALLDSLKRTPLAGSGAMLGEFIEFFGVPVLASDPSNLECFLRDDAKVRMLSGTGGPCTNALPPDAFDFFLVDLSYGEKPGQEPFGYEVIWKLKRICPGIPILVHSAFGQRSHVIRAVQHGADWYCRKGEASRLIDHLASHVMTPRWTLAPEDEQNVILPPGRKGADAQELKRKKYLYTRLLRDIPGDRLRITRLRGAGGAETARVEKELGCDLSRVSPTVVKIGVPDAVRMEQERYARFISPYLGNHVGRIDHRVVQAGACHAAIGYTFAGQGGGRSLGTESRVVSYSDYLQRALRTDGGSKPDAEQLLRPLDVLFSDIMPRIHDVQPAWDSTLPYPNRFFDEFDDPACSYLLRLPAECRIELTDILEPETGKTLKYAKGLSKGSQICLPDACIVEIALSDDGKSFKKLVVLQRVETNGVTHYRRFDVIPPSGDVVIPSRRLRRLGRVGLRGKVLQTGQDFWQRLSSKLQDGSHAAPLLIEAFECFIARLRGDTGRVGIIHGDLHFENVLLDARWTPEGLMVDHSPWLIDFGRTRRDDIVHDFTVAEEFVINEFLSEDMFPVSSGSSAKSEFLTSWLLSPWNRPPCLKQDSSGRLSVIYTLLSRIRNAGTRSGVAGAFGDDKRYLSSLGLYLLWLLKWISENKDRKKEKFLRSVCTEAIQIIMQHVHH